MSFKCRAVETREVSITERLSDGRGHHYDQDFTTEARKLLLIFLDPSPWGASLTSHISVMFKPHKDPCLILLVLTFNDLNIDYPPYLLFITFDYEWLEHFTNFQSILKSWKTWLTAENIWRAMATEKNFRMHNAAVIYLEHISILTCMHISNIYVYCN